MLISYENIRGQHMRLPQTNYFDAHLPGARQAVRIASFYDAKVFACRWTIRDKDPALKALLRHMDLNRGQRDLATETDAHLTRNVSHVASVVISQQDRVKFQIFCQWFSFGGEVLVCWRRGFLDAKTTSRILEGLTRSRAWLSGGLGVVEGTCGCA